MGHGRNQRRAQNHRDRGGNIGGDKNNNKTLQYADILRGIGYNNKKGSRIIRNRRGNTNSREECDFQDAEEIAEAMKEANKAIEEARERENTTRIGDLTRERPDGVFRLMAGNVNNMSHSIVRQRKIGEIQQAIDYWDVQGIGLSEVGIDFRKLGPNHQMYSWFRANREMYKISSAHNTNDPPISTSQPGGIGLIACKELKQYIKSSSGDFRKLGRWNSWIISSNPEHKTRMVVGYQVAKSTNKNAHNTIFLQHRRYSQHKGINLSPRELFQRDLITSVRTWRREGERLIIFVDFNEHALTGKLPRLLQAEGLVEATNSRWGTGEPATFCRGSIPIDGVYITQDLEVTSLVLLPFNESIGDHRSTIVDISTRSAVGEQQYRIVRPEARRLSTRNKKATKKYLEYVTKAFSKHNLADKLTKLEKTFEKGISSLQFKKQAEAIDRVKISEMKKGEKKCRKITSQYNLPFSPEIQRVYRLQKAYANLQRYQEGRSKNSNIITSATKAGIENPRNISVAKCIAGVTACRRKMKDLEKKADNLRREHLRDRLLLANKKGDVKRKTEIQQIMTNERSKDEWRTIKFGIGKPNVGAITKIQKQVNGIVIDITDVDRMNKEIQDTSRARFTLALSAPIQNSSLKIRLGNFGETIFAKQLLEGTGDIPLDVEEATKELIEEMMVLWDEMVSKHEVPLISSHNYIGHWNRVRETTSSSISTIHFGHWKAFLQSPALVDFECRILTLIARSGIPLERWSTGLQVMLEKTPGVSLVDKLRFILLIEGDKNAYNRMLIGYKAVRQLEEIGYIPEDQYSQRGSTAEDSKLDNRLTLDISRQMRINMTAISADADQCYDRINHIVLAMALRAVCGDPGIARAMLEAIQNMKYYQRTGRGDSNTFMCAYDELLQGLCQGNTAGPGCWIILSSIMIRCYEKAGHGSKLRSAISGMIINFMGEIFVDDTDLLNILMDVIDITELMEITQGNLDKWARLLIATGGALKPGKCYWYLISYVVNNGVWEYDENFKHSLSIQLPDGSRQEIEQLKTNESRKMLGVWSNPRGIDDKHIEEIVLGKSKNFLNKVKNAHLPTFLVWKAYRSSVIPGLRYGLSTLATSLQETQDVLSQCDFELLSYLGVNNRVRRVWRTIPREFGGIGLWNFTTEQCISWMEALLQHYGTNTTISKKLHASLEALQLEIGSADNPLLADFDQRGCLATSCWMKAVWERLHFYKITLNLKYNHIPLPRERDMEIVELISQYETSKKIKLSLNRCRIKHQALFLSCLATYDGTRINQAYLQPPQREEQLSGYRFSKEQPTANDWSTWNLFWQKVYPTRLQLPLPLGKWKNPSHRLWQWVIDPRGEKLYRQTLSRVEYYTKVVYSATRAGGTFSKVGLADSLPCKGKPVDATFIHPNCSDGVKIQSRGGTFDTWPASQTTFWSVLAEQGGEWMWLNVEGDKDDMTWLASALSRGSIILAADGSYNVKQSTLISGAGWIVYCTSTGRRIRGSAFEKSYGAGSYRGEMLGLLALYALLATSHSHFNLENTSVTIVCDNKSALGQATRHHKRVTPSEKATDILRAIRTAKLSCHGMTVTKKWVKSHVDDLKAWTDLSIEQQLNTICDDLAKDAVADGVADRSLTFSRLLPYESAAIIINGYKVSDGMATELRHQAAMADARRLYTSPIKKNKRGINIGGLGWDLSTFNSVDWRARHRARQSEMHSLWLCKQEIGICRTRRNNARILAIEDDKCPNCEQPNEDSKHLNLCPDPGRSRLFRDGATKLRRWMSNQYRKTEPAMATALHDFIRLRGSAQMASLTTRGPPILQQAAIVQDKIGWIELMNGKVAIQLVQIQQQYCKEHTAGLDGKSWASNLVRQLWEMSHSQWLYRNFSLHHQTIGYLRKQEEDDLRRTARELAALPPEKIPKSSQYLLEIDIDSEEQTFNSTSYWVLAMKAAQKERQIEMKKKRHEKREDEKYGRNWTPTRVLQEAATSGKRDHSNMTSTPPLKSPIKHRRIPINKPPRRIQPTITNYTHKRQRRSGTTRR